MSKNKEVLLCPGCGAVLRRVFAEASYGRVVALDQCPGCGGVWFDKWELYFVKGGRLKALASVDVKALNRPSAEPGSGACPRCGRVLKGFTDPGLPLGLVLKRCAGCSGLWLNRGELAEFAEHRYPGAEPVPVEGPEGVQALKRLQKELDVSSIAEPAKEAVGLEARADPYSGLDGKEFVRDLGLVLLQSLVRLVWRF